MHRAVGDGGTAAGRARYRRTTAGNAARTGKVNREARSEGVLPQSLSASLQPRQGGRVRRMEGGREGWMDGWMDGSLFRTGRGQSGRAHTGAAHGEAAPTSNSTRDSCLFSVGRPTLSITSHPACTDSFRRASALARAGMGQAAVANLPGAVWRERGWKWGDGTPK